jgi:hypothetical protein
MRILPLGVLLAVLASACDLKVGEKGDVSVDLVEGRASDEWRRTYTLPTDGRLEIFNGVGSIEAFPATGGDVEVIVQREVKARSDEAAAQALNDLRIEEEVTPAVVRISSRRGEGMRGFGRSLEYRVNLPPGLNVSLSSENGVVRIENVQGTLALSATNGGINGRGLTGPLEARVVNGGISVDLTSVTGDIRMTSVNGGIRLFVAPDANATFDARSVNGGIVIQDGLPVTTTERERLHVSGTINAGGPTIELQSTNGPIRLGPLGADSSAETPPRGRGRP